MTESTEMRIIDAAAQLFAERGYSGTTTRLLADRAGVNEVTIFRLFGTKKGVLAALMARMGEEGIAAEAARGAIPEHAVEALHALAHREFESAARFGAVAARMVFDMHSQPELADLFASGGPKNNLSELASRFEAWQARGEVRGDLDPHIMAEAFSSLTSTYVIFRQVLGMQPTGELPSEATMQQLVDIFLTGVLVTGAPK